MQFLQHLLGVILAPFVLVAGLLSPAPVPQFPIDPSRVDQAIQNTIDLDQRVSVLEGAPAPALGATNAIPTTVALFEDSLASKITSTQSTMTLVRGTDKTGTALASSTYAFIIDEGLSNEEFVLADCTGTTCTNLTRGISPISGTTTVAALKKEHRRGSSVKITDGPQLMILSRILNGIGTVPNILRYTSQSAASFTNNDDIVNRAYVDSLSFGAIPASSETASGFVELAAGCEAASSTSSGSAARLVIPGSLATSSWNSAALAACKTVVANNNGLIDQGFLPSTISKAVSFTNVTSFTGAVNAFATTSLYAGDLQAWQIGKQNKIFSSTGTTTFSVPSGISKVKVTTIGAGGAGGGCTTGGSNAGDAGGGGGGGGTAIEWVDVSATSTIQVFVGTGGSGVTSDNGTAGTWSTFGTNGFYNSASGGSGGLAESSGGAGGVGTGGTLNLSGGGGNGGADSTGEVVSSGVGGSSTMGGGGAGVSTNGNSTGGNYGGGGGGGACPGNNQTAAGGSGAQGIVIVEW